MIPLVALMSVAVIGMVGLGLDAAGAYGHERDDHNAADAAALLGAKTLLAFPSWSTNWETRKDETVKAVQDVASRNGVTINPDDVAPVDYKGNTVGWDTAYGVRVTAHTEHKTHLLGAVGLPSVKVTVNATAATFFPSTVGGIPLTLNNVDPHLNGDLNWYSNHDKEPPEGPGPPSKATGTGAYACFMITGGLRDPNGNRVNPPTCERNFGTFMPTECKDKTAFTNPTQRACVIHAFLYGSPVKTEPGPPPGTDNVYGAGDVDQLKDLTRNALKCHITPALNPVPPIPDCPPGFGIGASERFVAGNPAFVNVVITTGEFGNPTVTAVASQQMTIVSVGEAPSWIDRSGSICQQYLAQWQDAVVVRFPRDWETLTVNPFQAGGPPPSYNGSTYISNHYTKLIG
jgi:hypothetical protein